MSASQVVLAFLPVLCILPRSLAVMEHPPEISNSPDYDPRCRSNEYWHENAQRCAEFCGDNQKCNVDEQCHLKTNTCQHSCHHLCDDNTQFCDPAMTACRDCSSICDVQEVVAYPCDAYCPNWDALPARNFTDGMLLPSTLNAIEYLSTEEPPKNITLRYSILVITMSVIATVLVWIAVYIVIRRWRSRRKQLQNNRKPIYTGSQTGHGLEIFNSPLLAPEHHDSNQIHRDNQEEISMLQVAGAPSSVISDIPMQDAENSSNSDTRYPSFTPYNSVDCALSIPSLGSDGPPAVRFAYKHDPNVHHYNAAIREARGHLSWGDGENYDPALEPQFDHPQDWPKDSGCDTMHYGCDTMRYGEAQPAIDDAQRLPPVPVHIEPRHSGVSRVESRGLHSPVPDLQRREVTPSSVEVQDE